MTNDMKGMAKKQPVDRTAELFRRIQGLPKPEQLKIILDEFERLNGKSFK